MYPPLPDAGASSRVSCEVDASRHAVCGLFHPLHLVAGRWIRHTSRQKTPAIDVARIARSTLCVMRHIRRIGGTLGCTIADRDLRDRYAQDACGIRRNSIIV